MKKFFAKYLHIIILLTSVVIFFFNIIIRKNFIWEDFPVFYFPLKFYVFNFLKTGSIPLWNPNLNLGYPIIADTTAAIFYPLNWLIVPFIANNISIDYWLIELWTIFHLFFAGLFMYYLVDYLTNSHTARETPAPSLAPVFCGEYFNPAALISAIAFMFSGFFIGHLKHIAQITTACWLPLIFLFLYKSFKGKKYVKNSIYAGVFLGISILSGHLQIVYHFSFFLGLFILWKIIYNVAEKKNCLQIMVSSLITVIIAISLSAIQLLPFLEFLNNSTRQKISADFASSFSIAPSEFIANLFLPHTFGGFKSSILYWGSGGNFWETAAYIGIFTIILTFIALIRGWRKDNLVFFLLFSSLLCLGLAFGDYSFLHPLLLNVIPGLNMIRAPVRFILPVIFSLSVLAGFGFNHFLNFFHQLSHNDKQNKIITENLLKFLKLFLTIIDGFLVFLLLRLLIKPTIKSSLLYNLITFNLIITSILIAIYLFLKKKIKPRFFAGGLIIILFIDLLIFGWCFNNGDTKPEEYYPKNEFMAGNDYRRQQTPSPRIINDNYLMPNSAFVYNLPTMGSNHYMMIKNYYEFTDKLAENLYYRGTYRNFINFFNNKTKLNLLGIKYIISKRNLSKWFPAAGVNIYQNNDAYPDFILSRTAVVKKNRVEILKLLNKNYNPQKLIYINEYYQNNVIKEKAIDENKINIINYQPERIELEIINNDSNWLLANEIYYPGWQATIDNKPTKIYQANYTFRAAQIPTGKHTVEFIFKPKSYLLGKIVSSLSLSILIIFRLIIFKKRIKNIN